MSGMSMVNSILGDFILLVILIPQMTRRRDDVLVLSASSVASEVLVLYSALMLRSVSITSPTNLTVPPSFMLKSLFAIPRAAK